MKMSEMFPSKYLKASDLKSGDLIVTIDRVDAETFENDGRKQIKPVIHFKENGVKPFVCNKTNATVIERISGSDDTDKWIGKKVALFPDFVAFKGAAQEAIRVKRAPDVPFNDTITM
jgi:hypothetical protein